MKSRLSIIKLILLISILFFLLNLLTGCALFNEEQASIKDKVNTEVLYLDNELISIANKLNNISFEKYSVKIQKEIETPGNSNSQNSSNNERWWRRRSKFGQARKKR